MNSRKAVVLCLLSFALTARTQGQVPQMINYQGRVSVGNTNFNGTGQFKFAFVNGLGNVSYWSNDGSSLGAAEPTLAVPLTVTKGSYAVMLGDTSVSNMTHSIPPEIFTNSNVRLRVWFSDGIFAFQQLSPDQRLAAVGYAMMAEYSMNVVSGAVQAVHLAETLYHEVVTKIPRMMVFTNSGTFVVPAGITRIMVEAWGGGGGGAGWDNGGAGGYGKQVFEVTPGDSYNVVVGAGGSAGSGAPHGSDGGSGGNSTFGNGGVGTLITSYGGGGATWLYGAEGWECWEGTVGGSTGAFTIKAQSGADTRSSPYGGQGSDKPGQPGDEPGGAGYTGVYPNYVGSSGAKGRVVIYY